MAEVGGGLNRGGPLRGPTDHACVIDRKKANGSSVAPFQTAPLSASVFLWGLSGCTKETPHPEMPTHTQGRRRGPLRHTK